MRYHFIAIGGSAMHGLAIELKKRGNDISGSDDEIFEPSYSRLKSYGLLPEKFGWFPEKITKDLDAVIVGMHAKSDNPELLKAIELNLPIYSYPSFIYEHSKNKLRIVIAGSFAKTTITSILIHVLKNLNYNFDFVVGSYIPNIENTISLSTNSSIIVIEGDEYPSAPFDKTPKFLHYKPNILVITGIHWDHINTYPTFNDYVLQFKKLISTLTPDDYLIWNENDGILKEIINLTPAKKKPYKELPYKIINGKWYINYDSTTYEISLIGKHNIQNISAALEVCKYLNVNENDFFKSVSTFTGAHKRLQKIYESSNNIVFLDFAHSPIKVKETIKAVKETYSDFYIIAGLELFTYSSLQKNFLPNYKDTLNLADKASVFINPDVLKLKRLPFIEKEYVINSFNRNDLSVFYSANEFFYDLLKSPREKNIFLLMSSGNFSNFDIKEWVKKLK